MAKTITTTFEARPFAGLPGEPGWVAMREIVPAAVAEMKLLPEHGGATVKIVTVLPSGFTALHRPDGEILLSVQDALASDDVSRDLAAALLAAVAAEPGTPIAPMHSSSDAPRLQDILDLTVPFAPEVTNSYEFWVDGGAERTAELAQSLADAADATVPTEPVPGVEWAYWCQMTHPFLRWVRPEDEDELIKAMARLKAAHQLNLALGAGGGAEAVGSVDAGAVDAAATRAESGAAGEGRFLGMFRAAGLCVPVWELPDGTTATELTKPLQALDARLTAALAVSGPLDAAERRAREGIVSRQVTLR